MSASKQIYMLELFIENLKVNANFNKYYNEKSLLSLLAKFEPIQCIEIPQEIFQPLETDGAFSILKWNTGKSVLFASNAEKIENCIKNTALYLVLRNKEPEKIVGKAQLELENALDNIGGNTSEWMEKRGWEIMKMRESVALQSEEGKELGSIELELRLSSHGTSIVTKVSKNGGEDNFRFSAEETPINANCKACNAPQCGKFEEVSHSKEAHPQDRKGDLYSYASSITSTSRDNALEVKIPTAQRKKLTRGKRKPVIKKLECQQPQRQEEEMKRSCGFGRGPKERHAPTDRHYQCIQPQSRPFVPKNHGWAWTKVPPQGIQKSSRNKWRPGYYHKGYLTSLKKRPAIKNVGGKSKRQHNKEKPLIEKEAHKPSLKVFQKNGIGRVTFTPEEGASEQHHFPVSSDDSDFELEFLLPKTRKSHTPHVRHKAQQFNEDDFQDLQAEKNKSTISTNEVKIQNNKSNVLRKNAKSNYRNNASMGNNKKSRDKKEDLPKDDMKLNAWDEWIMLLPPPTTQGENTVDEQKLRRNLVKPQIKTNKTPAKQKKY